MPPPFRLHFIVAGFSKCGTTTLCELLGAHPQLYVPGAIGPTEFKEPNFFVEKDFEKHWETYQRLFARARPGQLRGEGSVAYATTPGEILARERILKTYPEIRLIFIARDPVDRIESSFAEYHHSGPRYGIRCPFDLGAALEAIPEIIANSRFWDRLSNYRAHMPAEQMHVVFLEELEARPDAELRRCFDFLGVDPDAPIPDLARRANPRSAKLRDTEQWRALRADPWLREQLDRIDLGTQDQLLAPLGYREPFPDAPIAWSDETRRRVAQALRGDIKTYLEASGRPIEIWPRFAELVDG